MRRIDERPPSDPFMRRVHEIRTWGPDQMVPLPKLKSADATERSLDGRYHKYKFLCARDKCFRGMLQRWKLLRWEWRIAQVLGETLIERADLIGD